MEDVDGDGQQDLVSQMGERVSFHLARPEIDALPSWQLDLAEYKTAVSASDIDLDDLLSAVSGIANWRIEDLDGEGARDHHRIGGDLQGLPGRRRHGSGEGS